MSGLEINFQLSPKLLGILENDTEVCPITWLYTVAAFQLSFPDVLVEIIRAKTETQFFTFLKRIKIEFDFFKQAFVCMYMYSCMYILCVYVHVIHIHMYVYAYFYMKISCTHLLWTLISKIQWTNLLPVWTNKFRAWTLHTL